MSRRINLWQDPHGDGPLYPKKSVTIKSGVTVLVGCNGAGKTTLIHNIKDSLKDKNIPYVTFDNLRDGGANAISKASFYEDFSFMATSMSSSEGENIVLNIGNFAGKLRNFVVTGKSGGMGNGLAEAFRRANGDEPKEDEKTSNERWILIDAADSGLSIDNVVDIKEYLFKTILADNLAKDKEIYIIVSANEYEMARGENCLNVSTMSYVKFADYEEYRNAILASRELKEKRHAE